MRTILKDFTGGINRATDPVKMKDNEFYDFQNLIIYKLGSLGNAVKRYGIENYHSRSILDTDKAMQVYQYISNSKTSNFDRLIVKSDSKLKYTTGSGYTDIASDSATNKVKFLTFLDNLYIFNRSSTTGGVTTYYSNQFYDGTNLLDMGVPPCPNTFSVAHEHITHLGLNTGTYYYLITYIYDDGQESFALMPTNYSGSDTSSTMWLFAQGTVRFVGTTISGANEGMRLNSIPTGNARVVKRRIYRTKKTGTGDFYFIADIDDNTTTTYLDTTLDSDLIDVCSIQYNFRTPIAKYGISHKGRVFIGNIKENQWETIPSITTPNQTTLTTFTDTAYGQIKDGTYNYKFANLYDIPSLNSTSGKPMQGFIGGLSSAKSVVMTGSNDKGEIQITNINNIDDFSGRVIIYRTKAGGSTYYPIGVTALNGTTYIDRVYDAELDEMEYLFNAMGIEKVTTNKILPSTVEWSDAGSGDIFSPDNSIEVDANDNDVITGLVSEDDGVLIFKERNIYKLYTDRETTYWQLRKVVSNVGCSEPYSIVTIGVNTHLFMNNNEIWIYSNGNVKRVSEKIQSIIDGYTVTNVDVCFHPKRNWVVWTIGHDSVNEIFVLDLNFPQDNNIGSWYYFTHSTTTTNGLSVRSPISTKDGKLLFGSDLPHILQYGKTPNYIDYINANGTASTDNIYIKLKKYFDYDEWIASRILVKLNPEVTANADNLTIELGGASTGSISATNGRINYKITTIELKTSSYYIYSIGSKELEIKEVGFDYTAKHQNRGSY